jgi:peptidoglycan/LPS O-acetylase OafA/YrhL
VGDACTRLRQDIGSPEAWRLRRAGKLSAMRVRLDPGLSAGLDHLRWLAAFLVLLGHVRLHTIGSYGSDVIGAELPLVRAFFLVTGLGHQAVICFFVLSGVLVAGKFVGRPPPTMREYGDYLLDRLTRIWIVAIPALLFSAVVAQLSLRTIGAFHNALADRCQPGITDLAVNLAFLHKAFWPTICSNSPYWNIHNEVWYYVLFPAMLAILGAASFWARGMLLLLVGLSIGALLLFDPRDEHNTLTHFPIWAAGALVAVGWRCRVPVAFAVALLLAALVVARAAGDWHFLIKDYLVALGLLLLLLAIRDATPPACLLAPGLSRLGSRLAGFSYSLYLVHAPVIFLIRTLLEEKFDVAFPIRQVGMAALAIMLLEALAALLVAQLFYLACERHTAALRGYLRARLKGRGARPARTAG